MMEDGTLIRLFPVPFRLINDSQQFRKWQWITARVIKSKADHRPESHRIFVDTITCDPKPLSLQNQWQERRPWIDRLPIYSDFAELEAVRQTSRQTLALLRPSRILGLDITPAEKPDWTPEELAKLIHLQEQGELFDPTDKRSLRLLRKLPFDFHYRYACDTAEGVKEHRHKINDWEIGVLYWKVREKHGEGWKLPFAAKLEQNLPAKDLMFLMGTMHRFPDRWLIVSLIYPPKQQPAKQLQGSLF
jgi:hypothetical protein